MNDTLRAATKINEAGAVFSKKNKSIISQAFALLRTALVDAGFSDDDDDGDETDKPAEQTAAKQTRANEAGGFSMSDVATLISQKLAAGGDALSYDQRPQLNDVYDDYFVYRDGYAGPFFSVPYTVTENGAIEFGMPTLVVRKVQYVAPDDGLTVTESGVSIVTDCVELVERAVRDDGSTRIKIIAPGIGSSGYYPADVLRRDGPRVFKTGTQMFWDHMTAQERASKPEGSLNALAAVLTSDAEYIENGPRGAGLYANARVFEDFRERVNDIAGSIGVSISASGKAKIGDVDGKRMPIITSIDNGDSVDFVTKPGAGGAVLELFESAKRPATENERIETMELSESTRNEIATMITAAVTAAVQPLQAQINATRDASDLVEAERAVTRYLATIEGLPAVTRQRLAPEIAREFQRTESGAIDNGKLIEAARARVRDEIAYLRGAGAAGVRGFGESVSLDEADRQKPAADNDAEFGSAMADLFGLSETATKTAVRGRG